MDGEEQHHLREVPADPAPRHRVHHSHRLARGLHRRVLPPDVGALALPPCHALPHRRPHGRDHLRVRGHEPRRRCGGSREGVQGVPAAELLRVAEDEDFGSSKLDAH
ncbi:unnamed protein product [Cuscuta epithymum]|uniref:Uncharacterized protein n=1 Tax=Cuscuta epithymum TaxID=186058 RepID=A0AAV0F3A4_9ASTE|nr:unnamed protein product [Cuscuta epithymum]